MNKINKILYWAPRILSIVFILFLMMFSLDIFGNNYSFWETILGLFMHNIPAMILGVILIISWKYEIVGGIVFTLAGIAYITMTIINANVPWYIVISWSVTIAGLAFLIGILFFINCKKKKGIQ